MARKKKRASPGRSKLHKTAGDAAAALTGQMESFSAAALVALRVWDEHREDEYGDTAEAHLDTAIRLAETSAKLGHAIAAMKGESRKHFQHISVERLAGGKANAATRTQPETDKFLAANAESGEDPPEPGGGG